MMFQFTQSCALDYCKDSSAVEKSAPMGSLLALKATYMTPRLRAIVRPIFFLVLIFSLYITKQGYIAR